MNKTHIRIASFVAVMALSPALFAEHETANAGASTESQLKTNLEGRIISLREYLSGSTSWMTSTSTSPSIGGEAKRSDATSRSTGNQQAAQEKDSSPKPIGTSPSTPSSSTPSSVWSSATMPAGEEPLVFVVKSETTATPTGSQSGRSETTPSSQNSSSTLGGGTAHGSEAYVLLFNPSDVGSRNAFARAKTFQSSRAAGTPGGTPTADRLRVKGTDESGTSVGQKSNERDPNATGDSSRAGTSQRDSDQAYWHAGMAGKLVKVSGKVLARGGLQAIEITSLQDMGSSTPSSYVPKEK